jgi:toxin ParE1/3/4
VPRRDWRIRLSSAAERDYLGIIEWTAETFGVRQARAYGRTLMLALRALGANPNVPDSQARDAIRHGLRSLHVARKGRRGRHFIVYRVVDGTRVDVVRILHDSMDLSPHVPTSESP